MTTEFQYPDGWYMRVGQIYSSPYEDYHALITRFKFDEGDEIADYWIYYKPVNPQNYNEVSDEEERSRAWWFNEGVWDLEKEPDSITLNNGNTITMLPLGYSARGRQSEYFFGIDIGKK
jgi:hypothetical protein